MGLGGMVGNELKRRQPFSWKPLCVVLCVWCRKVDEEEREDAGREVEFEGSSGAAGLTVTHS